MIQREHRSSIEPLAGAGGEPARSVEPGSDAPLVSVVIPVYDQAPFLPDAVASVLGQELGDLELILVDDGSTDGSGALCDGYADADARVHVIHQTNAGLSAARNAGIERACGTWLAFVDADDVISPNYLRVLHSAAIRCEADIAIARVVSFAGDASRLPRAVRERNEQTAEGGGTPDVECTTGREACWNIYDTREFIRDAAWGKLYRRELFDAIRFPIGRTREDAFVSHELLWPRERVALCRTCFYGYRRNPDGIMARPISSESFDALDAFTARIAYFERVGDAELARRTEWFREHWQAEMVSAAILADREDVIPERWRISEVELLRILGAHATEAGMRPLLAQMLERIRSRAADRTGNATGEGASTEQSASQRTVPLVSVIVPVFNREHYLEQAVMSILEQDLADFELILVDDGSTDGSPELCDGFAQKDARVRVIRQPHAGVAAARNAGLAAAHGEWICFIDSDDVIGRSYLRMLHDACVECSVDMAVARMLQFADEAPAELEADTCGVRIMSGRDACVNTYRMGAFFLDAVCGKLYRASCFEDLRFPIGRIHEDAFVSHELLYAQERIVLCEGCVYGYRKNPEGIMYAVGEENFDALEAFEARIAFFERVGDVELAEMTRAVLRRWHTSLLVRAILAGREAEIPERWHLGDDELVERLVRTPGLPGAEPLLVRLTRRIREREER